MTDDERLIRAGFAQVRELSDPQVWERLDALEKTALAAVNAAHIAAAAVNALALADSRYSKHVDCWDISGTAPGDNYLGEHDERL